jgi:hypothetical protein
MFNAWFFELHPSLRQMQKYLDERKIYKYALMAFVGFPALALAARVVGWFIELALGGALLTPLVLALFPLILFRWPDMQDVDPTDDEDDEWPLLIEWLLRMSWKGLLYATTYAATLRIVYSIYAEIFLEMVGYTGSIFGFAFWLWAMLMVGTLLMIGTPALIRFVQRRRMQTA